MLLQSVSKRTTNISFPMIVVLVRNVFATIFRCFPLCRSHSVFDSEYEEKIYLLSQSSSTTLAIRSPEPQKSWSPSNLESRPANVPHSVFCLHAQTQLPDRFSTATPSNVVSGIMHPDLFKMLRKQMLQDKLVVPNPPTQGPPLPLNYRDYIFGDPSASIHSIDVSRVPSKNLARSINASL